MDPESASAAGLALARDLAVAGLKGVFRQGVGEGGVTPRGFSCVVRAVEEVADRKLRVGHLVGTVEQ